MQIKSALHFERSDMYVVLDIHKKFIEIVMVNKKGDFMVNERI